MKLLLTGGEITADEKIRFTGLKMQIRSQS